MSLRITKHDETETVIRVCRVGRIPARMVVETLERVALSKGGLSWSTVEYWEPFRIVFWMTLKGTLEARSTFANGAAYQFSPA